MNRLLKNCVQVLISLAVLVLLLEVIVTLSGLSATAYRTQPVDATSPYIHAKPNHEYVYAKGPFAEILQHHKTNNYGFNTDVQFSKYSNNDKVLYIGGSFVGAQQIAPKDSSGSILHHKTDYEVYPISTTRPTLSQHLAFAQFGVKEFNPKYVFDRFQIQKIDDFLDNPKKFNMIKNYDIPDGSPIGDFSCDY